MKREPSSFFSLKTQPLVASIVSHMQTNLPPEAFTKETLQEAFQWLQSQPDSVRELVHTPESLVSLYRKAKRQDNDAPVSSKNFMSELKTLAKGLEAFSDQSTRVTQSSKAPELKTAPVVTPPAPSKKPVQSTTAPLSLDSKSSQSVKDVRQRFNLGSDAEALRLLIALGYEKFNSFK